MAAFPRPTDHQTRWYYNMWTGAWVGPFVSATSSSMPPTTNSIGGGPDGVGAPPADEPTVPQEAQGPPKPWYDNDWTDSFNPIAQLAQAWNDGKDFLTKDHAAEWGGFYGRGKANFNELSMTGDVAAYRRAQGQNIKQQFNNVLEDAAKDNKGVRTV